MYKYNYAIEKEVLVWTNLNNNNIVSKQLLYLCPEFQTKKHVSDIVVEKYLCNRFYDGKSETLSTTMPETRVSTIFLGCLVGASCIIHMMYWFIIEKK